MQARRALFLGSVSILWLLAGCSNGRGSVEEQGGSPQTNGDRFSVGGTVTGLSGAGLVLRNNGGDDLAVGANGGFAFPNLLANGTAYAVSVATQPSGQTCAVSNGSGSVNGANVANVTVTCNAAGEFSIGGAVSGLVGSGLVLQNNGADPITIDANGPFTFPATLGAGASYEVRVATQPGSPSQTCAVSNGAGVVGSGDVTNIAVTCATGELSVGGSVSGLLGSGLRLLLNGGSDLSISANGPFTFATRLARGATYSVTVGAQPDRPPQTCTVRNPTGALGSSNVTNVSVQCETGRFSVGGVVAGLEGSGLRLRINDGDTLTLVNNGAFAFQQSLADGASYDVEVVAQPRSPAQLCEVQNARGTVRGANVADMAVNCTTRSFEIRGSVDGLSGSGLQLRLNNVETLNVQSDGRFEFDTPIRSGSAYRIAITQQPNGQSCTLANESGTVGGENVDDVRVTCSNRTFTIGGAVTGLLGSGLVLQNNGGNPLPVSGNGSFTFTQELANRAPYNVTVRTQPSNPAQTCSVSNRQGVVNGADVTNVSVNCTTAEYTIGGEVRNLEGDGLVLRNNGGDDLPINASGAFTFDGALPAGATYNVTIAQQPRNPDQTCSASQSSGVVSGNVNSVIINCETSAQTYRIRGRVRNLEGSGLVLQNNGGDDLPIASSEGRFTFDTRLPAGSLYNVTVASQPTDPDQTCIVENGVGVLGDSDVNDVDVRCDEEDDDD